MNLDMYNDEGRHIMEEGPAPAAELEAFRQTHQRHADVTAAVAESAERALGDLRSRRPARQA